MKRNLTSEFFTKRGTLRAEFVSLSYCFGNVIPVRTNETGKKVVRYHGCAWSRSRGRYSLVTTHEDRFRKSLKLMGIPYECGNDAPRGGMEGSYIDAPYNQVVRMVTMLREAR